MNGSWIRADVDFGVPGARLVVNLRSEAGQQLMHNLSGTSEPKMMAIICQSAIVRVRPELKDVIVCGMQMGRFGCISIDVLHPSLPKMNSGEMWQEQHLEPCPICKGAICKGVVGIPSLMRMLGDRQVEVCSQACCDKQVEVLTVEEHDEIWDKVIAVAGPRLKAYKELKTKAAVTLDKSVTPNATMLSKSEWLPTLCDHLNPDGKHRCQLRTGHEGSHRATGNKYMLHWGKEIDAALPLMLTKDFAKHVLGVELTEKQLEVIDNHYGVDPAAPGGDKSAVTYCNWCDDPAQPDPRYHPNGQVEHLLATAPQLPTQMDCGLLAVAAPFNDDVTKAAAAALEKQILGEAYNLPTQMDRGAFELSLVQSGKMFRCSKCGKVRLARDAASEGVCKTCHA